MRQVSPNASCISVTALCGFAPTPASVRPARSSAATNSITLRWFRPATMRRSRRSSATKALRDQPAAAAATSPAASFTPSPPAPDLFAAQDFLFHVAQSILAEEDFVADEECRTAEGAALDRLLRVLQEPVLDVLLLRARQQPSGIEA